MRGFKRLIAVAVLGTALAAPSVAHAASPAPSDVSATFWARPQIVWAAGNAWVGDRADHTFAPGAMASRYTASRVLALANQQINHVAIWSDPYDQAVKAGWLSANGGPWGTINQFQFDAGVVRMLGLAGTAAHLQAALTDGGGWHPPVPGSFGVEQVARAVGARYNVPFGADNWETWPSTTLRRANLAVQAFQLAHLPSYWKYSATQLNSIIGKLPLYPPLKRAALGLAFAYSAAPYVWGGISPQPQNLFGLPAAGGFDCSGFVWWVLKLHTYTASDGTWSGNSAIPWRTTYDMASHVPVPKRIAYANLRPGDILFWSSAPKGIYTVGSTVYHTGIYLGNGWTINSHGDGAGVTINYMGPGAGWYHDAFAFGWRVMPVGK
jgi:hypothetical protein